MLEFEGIVVGEELDLRCPDCGSSDVRQHYDDELAACNGCGVVFLRLLGLLPGEDDFRHFDEEDDDNDS